MLIARSPKQTTDDLVSLLLECHQRIREFGALALLIAKSPHSPPDEIADASRRVNRYFTEALPIHVRDEEQSIAPRLIRCESAVEHALDAMKRQHSEHEAHLRELQHLCTELGSHPEQIASIQSRLYALSVLLQAEFDSHLSMEESLIFPAIERHIPKDTQLIIIREMRQRRAQSLAH